MAEFAQDNRHRDHEAYDFEEVSYIHPPEPGSLELRTAPVDDGQLGEIRAPDVFQTEHRVYGSPFRYSNVTVENWYEYGAKGIELLADAGAITIVEDSPIVSVTVVGTGCSGDNYNICEWWKDGESLRQPSPGEKRPPTLIKRYRVVIRGGGLDNEDPFDMRNRYPADYTFRLIDVVVKKPAGG